MIHAAGAQGHSVAGPNGNGDPGLSRTPGISPSRWQVGHLGHVSDNRLTRIHSRYVVLWGLPQWERLLNGAQPLRVRLVEKRTGNHSSAVRVFPQHPRAGEIADPTMAGSGKVFACAGSRKARSSHQ